MRRRGFFSALFGGAFTGGLLGLSRPATAAELLHTLHPRDLLVLRYQTWEKIG